MEWVVKQELIPLQQEEGDITFTPDQKVIEVIAVNNTNVVEIFTNPIQKNPVFGSGIVLATREQITLYRALVSDGKWYYLDQTYYFKYLAGSIINTRKLFLLVSYLRPYESS